jgi:hypothetical protein
MMATDTSTWVAFLEGGAGDDAHRLDKALRDRQTVEPAIDLTASSPLAFAWQMTGAPSGTP